MNDPRRALACVAMTLGASFVLGACGAASKEPASPGAAEPVPTTVDQAVAALDQAENDLNRILVPGASPAFAQPPAGSASPNEPAAPAQATPPPPARSGGEAVRTDAAKEESGDRCETACRALASMSRAAEHLCGLAGETD